VIVYVPGTLKTGHIEFVPKVHVLVFSEPLLSLPNVPLFSVNPVNGEIDQTILGFTQDELVAVAPPVDESVKHT
jgi:hypothetical protein